MKIYLAGPIEICSEDEILVWRNYVENKLKGSFEIITPKYHLGSDSEIFENTKTNVEECDIVFAHLPKAINERRASYGTIFEVAYGFAINKRVIVISDDEFVHKHPVMNQISEMFYSLDAALLSISPPSTSGGCRD
tara:strand:+ start:1927 stop:2334 length:408 start_codon:yes stop_codon:yes gene_type:complete